MKPVYLSIAIHLQIALHLLIKRVKAACRTNEPQATFVVAMTLFSLLSVAPRGGQGWPSLPILLLVTLFWPATAFCINLLSPLPTPDKRP